MKFDRNYYEEIEIDLTGTCNLKCDRCSRNYEHAQHLKIKNIRKLDEIISQLNQYNNIKRIMLAGQVSEPTLYPEFIEFVEYLKSRNITVMLYTNASILNINLFTKLKYILTKEDSVHFTVCGTTQELHEKYRVGSNLDIILKNAEFFINENKNDYLQYIRFTYNLEDIKIFIKMMEDSKKNNFNIFNNYYIVESEGDRFFNNTINPRHSKPPKDLLYKKIFKELENIKEFKPICKSLDWKKIYIDQFGKEYPCYSFAEYERECNIEIVYNHIQKGAFNVCKLCSKKCIDMMKLYNLDFVC